ncbi:MAG: class I SAM-dependent methyltransferase [Rubrobacter sp.]|nr:class I SAM-dependent methyltransferase [Rubrobacter sp.]
MTGYGAEGWEQVDPYDGESPYLWVKLEHLGRYLFAADYLASRNHRGTVLDVGCGLGYGLPELRRASGRVVGVDPDPAALEAAGTRYAGEGIELLVSGAEDLPVGAGEAGAAVCFETLEHLESPRAALGSIYRALGAGGAFICSVPNAAYEARDAAGLPANRHHRQLFTYESLCGSLEGSGFEVLYRLGQPLSNRLLRRETELFRRGIIAERLGRSTTVREPGVIRSLSYLLAYPTAEAAEESYAMTVVCRKPG